MARQELHENYLKKVDAVQKVNEAHLKHKRDIQLINHSIRLYGLFNVRWK